MRVDCIVEDEPCMQVFPIFFTAHTYFTLKRLCLMNCAAFLLVVKCAFPIWLAVFSLYLWAPHFCIELFSFFEVLFFKLFLVDVEEVCERLHVACCEEAASHGTAMCTCAASTCGCELFNCAEWCCFAYHGEYVLRFLLCLS